MKSVRQVLWTTLWLNLLVAGAKIAVGWLSGALTLVSDGIHSLTDASSNVLGLVSIHWAARPADDDHHYGHHKFEVLGAAVIAVAMMLTAWEVLRHAIEAVHQTRDTSIGWLAFATVAGTLVINICVATYERRAAKRFKSRLLEADAAHTASDVYVSITVLGSLIAVRYEVPYVDPIIAAVIALYIGWTGWSILYKNAMSLTDTAPLTPEDVRRAALTVDGVRDCHKIRTRGWEGHIFIDLHVQIDPSLNTTQGHDIVHAVSRHLRTTFEGVEDVLIHTEPEEDESIPDQ
jgi:cation diffusion facilitator family transporter